MDDNAVTEVLYIAPAVNCCTLPAVIVVPETSRIQAFPAVSLCCSKVTIALVSVSAVIEKYRPLFELKPTSDPAVIEDPDIIQSF